MSIMSILKPICNNKKIIKGGRIYIYIGDDKKMCFLTCFVFGIGLYIFALIKI
jgi:ribosomal protein L36